MARINNLYRTPARAASVGRALISAHKRNSIPTNNNYYNNNDNNDNRNEDGSNNDNSTPSHSEGDSTTSITEHILLDFPPEIDFICLQEVFDRQAANILVQTLKSEFPFILYDIGYYTKFSRESSAILNSGLFFASRYPVVQTDFKRFSVAANSDRFACKGLLMVKILIQSNSTTTIAATTTTDGKKDLVAYVFNTHLNAGSQASDTNARLCQLNEIQQWRALFISQSLKSEQETVVFDVLTGDLNFDPTSDNDYKESHHTLIQQVYDDPCRENSVVYPVSKPGSLNNLVKTTSDKDKFWAVGTCVNKSTLWHPQISTPLGLSDALRWCDGDDENGSGNGFGLYYIENAIVDGRSLRGKRRLDYILFNTLVSTGNGGQLGASTSTTSTTSSSSSSTSSSSQQFTTRVKNVSFISKLARISDHIPMAVQYECLLKSK